jgi:hypothetical protein
MGVLGQKQHNSCLPLTKLFSVSPIEDKTESPPINTNEVIEAGTQAVLKTLTEHDFKDAFKNDRSAGNGAYARKVTTSRAMLASRPKVDFLPDDSTSLRNYG